MVSLATGGLAQWGWEKFRGPAEGPAALVLSGPDRSPESEFAQNAGRVPTPSASATGRAKTPSPTKRASRGSTRPSPTATPTAPKPSATQSTRPKPKPVVDARTALENETIRLTNAERAKNGCQPLRFETRLRDAARGHSEDMKQRGFFDHTTPDGLDPWERARAKGYEQPSGENIARGQQTAKDVVEAWMNSEGHRANIVNCDSKAIGVGVALGSNGPWWTQMFGFV